MIYVVPTLAAAGFIASSLRSEDLQTTRRVEEENESIGDEGIAAIAPDGGA